MAEATTPTPVYEVVSDAVNTTFVDLAQIRALSEVISEGADSTHVPDRMDSLARAIAMMADSAVATLEKLLDDIRERKKDTKRGQ